MDPIFSGGNYICFIYFPEKNSNVLKPFLSYNFTEDKKFHIPFLDFDRVIPIPDSVDDKDVINWIKENWKISSNSFNNYIEEDGIMFFVEQSNPAYLVKKMSKIIKQKLKLLYVCMDDLICGEYLAYPDKDGVHLIYKPFLTEAPEQILNEIQNRFNINISLSDNLKEMVDKSGK